MNCFNTENRKRFIMYFDNDSDNDSDKIDDEATMLQVRFK